MVSRTRKYEFVAKAWTDYELLALADGWKLERFGEVTLLRPEVNAQGSNGSGLDFLRGKADFEFDQGEGQQGTWRTLSGLRKDLQWEISWGGIVCKLQLTKFKHIGVFPEQSFNWSLIREHLEIAVEPSMINLFGYTGVASLVGRQTGAEVIHVDSVKQVIDWASENQSRSRLDGVKWIRDDAFKVAERMTRRGQTFDVVVMDPPAFGRAGKRIWKIEEQLEHLIRYGYAMLKPGGKLFLNTYTPKVSAKNLLDLGYGICDNSASIKCGVLGIHSNGGNVLPTGALLLVERGH